MFFPLPFVCRNVGPKPPSSRDAIPSSRLFFSTQAPKTMSSLPFGTQVPKTVSFLLFGTQVPKTPSSGPRSRKQSFSFFSGIRSRKLCLRFFSGPRSRKPCLPFFSGPRSRKFCLPFFPGPENEFYRFLSKLKFSKCFCFRDQRIQVLGFPLNIRESGAQVPKKNIPSCFTAPVPKKKSGTKSWFTLSKRAFQASCESISGSLGTALRTISVREKNLLNDLHEPPWGPVCGPDFISTLTAIFGQMDLSRQLLNGWNSGRTLGRMFQSTSITIMAGWATCRKIGINPLSWWHRDKRNRKKVKTCLLLYLIRGLRTNS